MQNGILSILKRDLNLFLQKNKQFITSFYALEPHIPSRGSNETMAIKRDNGYGNKYEDWSTRSLVGFRYPIEFND